MNFYSMMMGQNPIAPDLLDMLNLKEGQLGRYRDAFLQMKGDDVVIVIYTRNGGGNRKDYVDVTEFLQAHEEYIEDYDDDYDCTYASYVFKFPERYLTDQIKFIAKSTLNTEARWNKALEKLIKEIKR